MIFTLLEQQQKGSLLRRMSHTQLEVLPDERKVLDFEVVMFRGSELGVNADSPEFQMLGA